MSVFKWDLPISIHALLAESDNRGVTLPPHEQNFYPRSPCGERPTYHQLYSCTLANFYPRSPCGERHAEKLQVDTTGAISIHALLAESDGVFFIT